MTREQFLGVLGALLISNLATVALSSQNLDFIVGHLEPELNIPIGETASIWNVGGGATARIMATSCSMT